MWLLDGFHASHCGSYAVPCFSIDLLRHRRTSIVTGRLPYRLYGLLSMEEIACYQRKVRTGPRRPSPLWPRERWESTAMQTRPHVTSLTIFSPHLL